MILLLREPVLGEPVRRVLVPFLLLPTHHPGRWDPYQNGGRNAIQLSLAMLEYMLGSNTTLLLGFPLLPRPGSPQHRNHKSGVSGSIGTKQGSAKGEDS